MRTYVPGKKEDKLSLCLVSVLLIYERQRSKHFKDEEDSSGERAGKGKGQNRARDASVSCMVWTSSPVTGFSRQEVFSSITKQCREGLDGGEPGDNTLEKTRRG